MRDVLTLTLPAKAKYVLPLRLYISGIATRMDYQVNVIEDVKTAVSEACVLLLGKILDGQLHVEITADEELLSVKLYLENYEKKLQIGDDEISNHELSRMILEAMADECEIREQDGVNCEIDLKFTK